jgi:DNA replication initiation complex subunit (GINS family)
MISLILAATFIYADAGNRCDWKEKMMSERVAFLTLEMNLTPEEAQVFWPVYNQINGEKDEAIHNVFKAYKALDEAIKTEKSEKEISRLLDAYLSAKAAQSEFEKKADEQFRKVLPVSKVAKLYLGEEKFRRQHIRKLHEKR